MDEPSRRNRGSLACAIAALAVAVVGVATLTQRTTLPHLNSDLLFVETLFRDLAAQRPIGRWHLPGVLSLFPELPIYLPLRALSGDPALALFLYGVALLGLLVTASYAAMQQLRRAPAQNFLLSSLAGLILVAALQYAPLPLPVCLWPSYHGGALLAGLALLAATLALLRSDGAAKRPVAILAIAMVALAAVSALSDPFVAVQYLLPLWLAVAIAVPRLAAPGFALLVLAALTDGAALAIAGRATALDLGMNPAFGLAAGLATPRPLLLLGGAIAAALLLRRRAWLPRALQLAGVGLGSAIVTLLIHGDLPLPAPNGWPASALLAAARDLPSLAVGAPLLIATALAALALAGARVKNVDPATRVVAIFFLAALLASAVAATLGWTNRASARYLQPLYALPPFALAILFAPIHARVAPRWRTAGVAALLILSSLAILPRAASLRHDPFALPYPADLRCVDDAARALHLHAGYTDFWTARPSTILSRAGLRLTQLTIAGDLTLDPTIANPAWLLDGNDIPRYDFALFVAERPPEEGVGAAWGLDPTRFRARFGPPSTTRRCGHLELWVYDRPGDEDFRNFVRAPSLRDAGR